ncbi:MAG TPA: hypothetical protein VHO67_11500 [Polyangia bacterium]|nr:hypothetical protein [Polyangia bacterium]
MRCARRRLPALVALAAALGGAATARATLIMALDLPAMVGRAERIAVVDVLSVQAAWDARHERITTTIQLQVVEGWKGGLQPGAHLTVLQPGGTVGDVTTTVDGMPRFVPGERTLVFLHGPPERATVVGLTQGKRPLRREATSGRWMVRGPDRAGADFVRLRSATPAVTSPAVVDSRERPLDELRAQVQALAAAK